MRISRIGPLVLGLILATTTAGRAAPWDMMGRADRMMAGIQTAIERGPGTGDDGKGVACLPTGRRFLVSKIVDGERWMVMWDARMGMGLGDMSGNVVTDDGHVIFLYCTVTGVTGPDPERDSLMMNCDVGDTVVGPSGWHHLDDVVLPLTFFLP